MWNQSYHIVAALLKGGKTDRKILSTFFLSFPGSFPTRKIAALVRLWLTILSSSLNVRSAKKEEKSNRKVSGR